MFQSTTKTRMPRRMRAFTILALTFVILAGITGAVFAGKSTIGDLVYHDTDVDGQFTNEDGLNDVVVELWQDVDKDGVFSPTIDVRLGTTTTAFLNGSQANDDNGWYNFNVEGGIPSDPEFYLVVITDTNFAPGGPLEDYVYTGEIPGGEGTEPRPVVFIAIQDDQDDIDFPYALATLEMIKTAGNAVDGAIEYVQGPTSDVTYTYEVRNTGDTILDLDDPGYGITDDKCSAINYVSGDDGDGFFEAGETWIYQCTTTLDPVSNPGDFVSGQITNTAVVLGNPVGPNDEELPGNEPTDTDDAVVDVVNPAVDIQKTVFENPGTCPGIEVVNNVSGTPITYCFVVENTGDTLLDVTVDDPDLGVSFGVDTLAPGEIKTYTYSTQISGQLTNTATVDGTPVSAPGVPLPGIDPVEDTDTAEVRVPPDPGAIGDYVWYDADKDGFQDVDEEGIGNVTVILYDATDPGNLIEIARTETGADGGYIFTGLAAGDYVVEVDPLELGVGGTLEGYTHVIANQSLTSPTPVISLGTGEFYDEADFGYLKEPVPPNTAIIGDSVWIDGDGDGIQDPGEPGLPGVTVIVTPTVGPPLTAVTDENGNYLIEVPAGPGITYTVAPDPTDPDLTGYSPTTPQPVSVPELADGEQYLDADFGYTSPDLYTVGNLVWHDSIVVDGLRENGEPGIPGVTVDLIDAVTGDVVATTFTDENGAYLFEGVPAGSYLVQVTDTSNVLADYLQSPFEFPSSTSDDINRPQPWPVNLPADLLPSQGNNYRRADFAYVLNPDTSPGQSIIGNQVFFDNDGDGLFEPDDGDYGIEGVEMLLTYVGGPNDGVTETVTSGSSGLYAFTGLFPGDYTIEVNDTPANTAILGDYVITSLGPNPGQDNNNQVDPVSPAPYPVTIVNDGDTDYTADFGYTNPGEIGDYVWWDVNEDGIQDDGEPPIGGVLVELYDNNGDRVGSTTTLPDGSYVFPDLDAPVNYTVVISDVNFAPGGVLEVFGPTTAFVGDPAKDSNGEDGTGPYTGSVTADAPIARGQEDETIDFGFVPDVAVEVEKLLSSESPVRPGDLISWTIRITNTGQVTMTTVPLVDTYRPYYMAFQSPASPPESGFTPPGGSPVPADTNTITWDNVLASPDVLEPGETIDVIVEFVAANDTTKTDPVNPDDDVTVNVALVDGIEVDPDGPGPIPPAVPPLPPVEDDDDVQIINPTSVLIAAASLERTDEGAKITWSTVTESNIVGFNLLRISDGKTRQVNAELIAAVNAGQPLGHTYSVVDTSVGQAVATHYRLEIITIDGNIDSHGLGVLFRSGALRFYLPLMFR